MYANEKPEFAKMLKDLCMSVDRPFDEDMLRVFWDDLENVPYPQIERQAKLIRASGKKRFMSNDLRPPPEERAALNPDSDNLAVIDRINAYVNRHLWNSMSRLQRLYKREWVFTRDKAAPRCVALRIHPDVENEDSPSEIRYPGHYIKVEDCDLDYTPPLAAPAHEQTFADRYQNFNEADAVRGVLNRRE